MAALETLDDGDKKRQEDGFDSYTMKDQLLQLQHEDPKCVFMVRKIQRLGFDSPEFLREYFEEFGAVKGVFASHSRIKSGAVGPETERKLRHRPASLGFVVMETREAAQKILEKEDHEIKGFLVGVRAFQQHEESNPKVRTAGLEQEAFKACQGDQVKSAGHAGQKRQKKKRDLHDERSHEVGPSPKRQKRSDTRDECSNAVCYNCGSTIAASLGIETCQVCKR